MRPVEIKPRLGDGILDQTLLQSDDKRVSMVKTLLAGIFLFDSIYWLGVFMTAFVIVTTDLMLPAFPPWVNGVVCGGFALVAAIASVIMAFTRRHPIALSVCMLSSVACTGIWYTLATGSTLFARMCLVQWLMSFGTVIVAYRGHYEMFGLVMPELLFSLCVTALISWGAGVLSEPGVTEALVVGLPIFACVAYRYHWVVYGVIVPQKYRADEIHIAWSAFYTDIVSHAFAPCLGCHRSATAVIATAAPDAVPVEK